MPTTDKVIQFSVATSATINVSTEPQLQAAVSQANAQGNTSIVLADGTYTLTQFLNITGTNVTVRSASGNRANVIIQGDAMSAAAAIQFIFRVDANGFTVRDLTMRRVRNSLLQIVGENNRDGGLVQNCILQDSYEHNVKVSIGANNAITADNWIVEDCLFGYTAAGAPNYYTGGIDCHGGDNWIIRRNTFQNIAAPSGSGQSAAEHAIHIWDGASNNTIERNKVINCDRGIGYGLDAVTTNGPAVQSSGGVIKNNQIFHAANGAPFADVGIDLQNTTGTAVYNNTVFMLNSYPNAIEHRFTSTTNVIVRNNLTNKAITARDGATGTVNTNVTTAQSSWFVDAANGNLDLVSTAPNVIDLGATISVVTDDYGGIARPQGSAYDIGSDEFVPQVDPLSLPLATNQNLSITYLGFFNVPTSVTYNNGGWSLSSDGTQIYCSSGDASVAPSMLRFSIPALNGTATVTVARTGVSGTVATGGNISGGEHVTGTLVYNGSLYISVSVGYDASGNQNRWIKKANLTIGSQGTFCSMSGGAERRLSQGMGHVPVIWQSLLGGPAFTIGGRLSIVTASQCGYGFATFDPDTVPQGGGTVTVTRLLDYFAGSASDASTALEPVQGHHVSQWNAYPKNANGGTDLYSVMNAPVGTAFIPTGSRSLLYFTVHGYGVADNNCRPGSSVHNDPCRLQVVAYDLRDLVDVKNGVKQTYQPQPYNFDATNARKYWQVPNNPWGNCVGNESSGARSGNACYDPVSRKLYWNAGGWGETASEQRVHVWQIGTL